MDRDRLCMPKNHRLLFGQLHACSSSSSVEIEEGRLLNYKTRGLGKSMKIFHWLIKAACAFGVNTWSQIPVGQELLLTAPPMPTAAAAAAVFAS